MKYKVIGRINKTVFVLQKCNTMSEARKYLQKFKINFNYRMLNKEVRVENKPDLDFFIQQATKEDIEYSLYVAVIT